MGTDTQAVTIAELKQQLRAKEQEIEAQRNEAHKEKLGDAQEEIKDIKHRLVPELFNRDLEHDRRLLELEVLQREQGKKGSYVAGGGATLVVVLEALQYWINSGT